MTLTANVAQAVELAGHGIYGSYKVGNANDLYRWSTKIKGQVEPPKNLHCTIAYSQEPFNHKAVHVPNSIKLPKNSGRRLGRLGDGGAVVLFLAENEVAKLRDAWKACVDQGATWDYPSYIAHVTLAYDSPLSNEKLASLPAYDGPIFFQNPTFEPLQDEGASVEEAAIKPKIKLDQVVRALHPKLEKWRNGVITKIGKTKVKIAWDADGKENLIDIDDVKALTPIQLKKREEKLKPKKTTAKKPRTKSETVVTKAEIIKEIKGWIKEYKSTTSDRKAEKLKEKIYEALEKHQIKREEVGLKPIKVEKPSKTPKVQEEPKPKKEVKPKTPTKRSSSNPSLTENEVKMLLSLYNNNYGSYGDDVWAWAHNDSSKPHDLPKTTASGVIASLVKKGLMHSHNVGPTKDHTCGLTKEGQVIAKRLDDEDDKNNKPAAPTKTPTKSKKIDHLLNIGDTVKIIKGRHIGNTATITGYIGNSSYDLKLESGEEIFLSQESVEKTKKTIVKEVLKPITEEKPPTGRKFKNPLPELYLKQAQEGSKDVKIRYLTDLWKKLNEQKFEGKMKLPNIGLQKAVKVERMRRRGVWYPSQRRLEVSPHVFNNPDQLYEVFLHEMCHQAVHEITKLAYREINQGHGPVWQSWMIKVGLDPNRFDASANYDYMTEEQKKAADLRKELTQKAIEKEVAVHPARDKVAKWRDPKTGIWHEGIIVEPHDKAGKRWAFAKYPVKNVAEGWAIVPATWFYSIPSERHANIQHNLKERVAFIRQGTLMGQARRSGSRRSKTWF